MADQPATPTKEKDPDAPSRISGLSGKLKIGGILAAVVAAQCVLAWLLLPSAGSAQSADSKREPGATNHDLAAVQQEDPNAERREVDLGKFSVTSIDAATNTTLLIDFHLYGAVLVEPGDEEEQADGGEHGEGNKKVEGEPEDHTRFGRLLKKNKHRFRDQVIVIIRNAQMSDLSDPALGLIKRQILAKTNTLFGEPLLKEVIFSDFAVVQQ
jgi:flagellar FliL protein